MHQHQSLVSRSHLKKNEIQLDIEWKLSDVGKIWKTTARNCVINLWHNLLAVLCWLQTLLVLESLCVDLWMLLVLSTFTIVVVTSNVWNYVLLTEFAGHRQCLNAVLFLPWCPADMFASFAAMFVDKINKNTTLSYVWLIWKSTCRQHRELPVSYRETSDLW